MDQPITVRTEAHQHPNLRKLARALIALAKQQQAADPKSEEPDAKPGRSLGGAA